MPDEAFDIPSRGPIDLDRAIGKAGDFVDLQSAIDEMPGNNSSAFSADIDGQASQ